MARLTRQNPAGLIKISIVRHSYKTKPDKDGFRKLANRLYKKEQVLPVQKFASLVTTGAAYAPMVSDGQGNVRQQVFTLNFNHAYFTPMEFSAKCEKSGLMPALIVPSWRHSDRENFFHAIFITTVPVVSELEALKCQLKLLEIFPAARVRLSHLPALYVGSYRPNFCIANLSARVDILNP